MRTGKRRQNYVRRRKKMVAAVTAYEGAEKIFILRGFLPEPKTKSKYLNEAGEEQLFGRSEGV